MEKNRPQVGSGPSNSDSPSDNANSSITSSPTDTLRTSKNPSAKIIKNLTPILSNIMTLLRKRLIQDLAMKYAFLAIMKIGYVPAIQTSLCEVREKGMASPNKNDLARDCPELTLLLLQKRPTAEDYGRIILGLYYDYTSVLQALWPNDLPVTFSAFLAGSDCQIPFWQGDGKELPRCWQGLGKV